MTDTSTESKEKNSLPAEAAPEETASPPPPTVKNKSGPSMVWLIPLVTAIVGGWLVVKTISEKGPGVTITFKTAEGIEAGKTKIKYKEVEIGVVNSVLFSKDFSRIILKATIDKGAKSFLRRDTNFWVVRPRLSLRGASGLSTLVSGSYIEIEPGLGSPKSEFVGLDDPPVVKADVAGKKIVLLTKKLRSIDTGSPIYYQGILAGEVLGYELGNDRKSVFIHGFIKTPYDELIRSNTRFWNVSGVDVSIASEGISVRTESIQSLLFGGINFETPDSLERVKDDVEGLIFTLYDDYETIHEQSFTRKINFILFFQGSVRGLNIGAPVEFKGIKVGSVVDVRLEFDNRDASFRIPILIEIEPERVIDRGEDEVVSPYHTLKNLVTHGLRAQLRTGSLLTGQLFVDLDMHPDTPIRLAGGELPYPELPTIQGSLDQMATSVKGILNKVEKLDIDKLFSEVIGTLEGTNRLINSQELLGSLEGANKLLNAPELQEAVQGLQGSLEEFRKILHKLDQHAEPLMVNVEKALDVGQKALEKAQVTMGMVDGVLKPDSPFQFRFNQMTEELAETARSIRTLVDLLERNPKAVIFGKNPPGEK